MATKAINFSVNEKGFTLLELLLALAIGSIVMFATYTVVNDTFLYHTISSKRSQQLLDMAQIKRLLRNDLMAILPEQLDAPAIAEAENQLSLRCDGQVVWGMQLGPEVVVHYTLPQKGSQTPFTRTVSATSGKTLPIYDIEIQGLKEVHYEVLDQTGWQTLQKSETPILAMRWHFVWEDIGTWEILLPVEQRKT